MAEAPWQPTEFVRFEQIIGTSTSPARVLTDAGHAYLKAVNNPMGPHALVREFVGTSLARWMGLDTFDFAFMSLTVTDEIRLSNGEFAAPGTAFVARAAGMGGHSWDGTKEALGLLDNPEAISHLVALDTWLCNPDRCPPPSRERKPKPENVFFSPDGASDG